MTIKPNFFLVGAPKCGTSAMNYILSQHPEIFMSPIKEPHFFSIDLKPPYYIRNENKYLELFKGVKDEKIIGESSATYLYSVVAARRIKQFSPNAKILIILRNPADMMYSLYWQGKSSGIESKSNFEDALLEEEKRKSDAKKSRITFTLYKDAARYKNQVERYFKYIGGKNVDVIIYEEFKRDPEKIIRSIFRFLDVDDEFIPKIKILNPSRIPRSILLAKLIRILKPPKNQKTNIFRKKTVRILRKINNKFTFKPPINNSTRINILSDLKSEINDLGLLINKDLSFWYE